MTDPASRVLHEASPQVETQSEDTPVPQNPPDSIPSTRSQPVPTVRWSRLGSVYMFGNGKGGVGKTTSTVNMATQLASGGAKVLVIDLNRQANVGDDLGYRGNEAIDDGGRNLYMAITMGEQLQPASVRAGLDVCPGGEWIQRITSQIRDEMVTPERGQAALLSLARALGEIADRYNAIIIDTPPENEVLQRIALCASRWVIAPLKTDRSSREGIPAIAREFRQMRAHNPYLMMLGVFAFASGTGSTVIRRKARDDVHAEFGGPAHSPWLDEFVRHSEAAAQDARELGKSADELEQQARHNPKFWEVRAGRATRGVSTSSAGIAEDYEAIVEVLLRRAAAIRQDMIDQGVWP